MASPCKVSLKKGDPGYISRVRFSIVASLCPFIRGQLGHHRTRIDGDPKVVFRDVSISVKSRKGAIDFLNGQNPGEFVETISVVQGIYPHHVQMRDNPGVIIPIDEIETVISLYDNQQYNSGGRAQTTPPLCYTLIFK